MSADRQKEEAQVIQATQQTESDLSDPGLYLPPAKTNLLAGLTIPEASLLLQKVYYRSIEFAHANELWLCAPVVLGYIELLLHIHGNSGKWYDEAKIILDRASLPKGLDGVQALKGVIQKYKIRLIEVSQA